MIKLSVVKQPIKGKKSDSPLEFFPEIGTTSVTPCFLLEMNNEGNLQDQSKTKLAKTRTLLSGVKSVCVRDFNDY